MKHPSISALILNKNDENFLSYCLKAASGWFNRYVLYDVGSTDRSKDIFEWFINQEKHRSDIFVRYLPHLDPSIQGIFRNSMIAEGRTEWYFILDADEIYTDQGFAELHKAVAWLEDYKNEQDFIYGVVPRMEIQGDLKHAFGTDLKLPHHRLYHRTAIFKGPHPGEEPLYPLNASRQKWFSSPVCYHFHGCERSTKDAEVPKRLERRNKATYRRGELKPIDILKELPILRERIEDFPVCPALKKLQDGK
jgi:glycosyltransferase involved in cell wall biosynthesis